LKDARPLLTVGLCSLCTLGGFALGHHLGGAPWRLRPGDHVVLIRHDPDGAHLRPPLLPVRSPEAAPLVLAFPDRRQSVRLRRWLHAHGRAIGQGWLEKALAPATDD
jgi:hypothetical protein